MVSPVCPKILLYLSLLSVSDKGSSRAWPKHFRQACLKRLTKTEKSRLFIFNQIYLIPKDLRQLPADLRTASGHRFHDRGYSLKTQTMRCLTFFFLLTGGTLAAQDLQLHYDTRQHYPSLYFQYFKAQDS